jgi:hypothetical protein
LRVSRVTGGMKLAKNRRWKSHIVAKAAQGHQPGSTGNFGVNAQQIRYRFRIAAAEPALGGD